MCHLNWFSENSIVTVQTGLTVVLSSVILTNISLFLSEFFKMHT